MADEAKLLVALEARLDQFERQLKEAGVIAQRAADDIQSKLTLGSALGTFAGNIATQLSKELQKIPQYFVDAVQELAAFDGMLKRTNLSAEELQRTLFAAVASGIGGEQAKRDLDRLGAKIEEAAHKSNRLSQFMAANGMNAKNVEQALEQLPVLLAKAATETEKINILKLFGLTRDWVNVLGRGVDAFKAMKERAPIEEGFDKAVNAAKDLVTEINLIVAQLSGISTVFTPILEGLAAITRATRVWVEELNKAPSGQVMNFIRGFSRLAGEGLRQLSPDTVKGSLGPSFFDTFGTGTVTGPTPKSGVVHPDKQKKDALDRQFEQLKKNIAIEEAETATIGLSVAERAKAVELAKLTEAAVKSGLNAEQAITQEMRTHVDILAMEKQLQVERAAQLQQANELSKEVGATLADGFKQAALEGKKLDEVLSSMIKRLASRSIDRLFDMFFAPQPGQATSPFLQLLKGLAPRQAGGPVSSGSPYLVGERGPELFVPGRNGMIIPNNVGRAGSTGGATFSPVTQVDARGSQMSEPQFRAILAENNKRLLSQWNAAFPARVLKLSRFGT